MERRLKQFGRTLSIESHVRVAPNDFTRIAQDMAFRAADCLKIFRDVYGNRADHVIASSAGRPPTPTSPTPPRPQAKTRRPQVYFQELAIAPTSATTSPKTPRRG